MDCGLRSAQEQIKEGCLEESPERERMEQAILLADVFQAIVGDERIHPNTPIEGSSLEPGAWSRFQSRCPTLLDVYHSTAPDILCEIWNTTIDPNTLADQAVQVIVRELDRRNGQHSTSENRAQAELIYRIMRFRKLYSGCMPCMQGLKELFSKMESEQRA